MSASSNTFGTFLQTFDSLDKQTVQESPASVSPRVQELVEELARKGTSAPLEELVASSSRPKSEVLSEIMEGQSQGLLTIIEEQAGPVARLTGLGKVFAS